MSLMFFRWVCLFIPMEFYEDLIDVSHIQSFMVQKMLIIKGGLRGAPQGRVLTFWGGLFIRCWH